MRVSIVFVVTMEIRFRRVFIIFSQFSCINIINISISLNMVKIKTEINSIIIVL